MKKNRLVASIAYDFDLIGIVARTKEYKLAWHLNKIEGLHFIKCEDVKIEFKDQSRILISNFISKSDQHIITLLKNRLVVSNTQRNQHLLQEAQQFDYFLKLEYRIDDFDIDGLVSQFKSVPVIDYLARLDLDKLKQKENLLY